MKTVIILCLAAWQSVFAGESIRLQIGEGRFGETAYKRTLIYDADQDACHIVTEPNGPHELNERLIKDAHCERMRQISRLNTACMAQNLYREENGRGVREIRLESNCQCVEVLRELDMQYEIREPMDLDRCLSGFSHEQQVEIESRLDMPVFQSWFGRYWFHFRKSLEASSDIP